MSRTFRKIPSSLLSWIPRRFPAEEVEREIHKEIGDRPSGYRGAPAQLRRHFNKKKKT